MPLGSHRRSEEKIILDNVHDTIKIDSVSLQFFDTPEFQRLRDVKQLGLCYMVFPGATHSRLEHSLGVYNLARSAVQKLDKYWPELQLDNFDLASVSLAGLLHDVGHGPFSHVFENEFLPRVLPGRKWHHEDMSGKLVDFIADSNYIDVDPEHLKRVKNYILCSSKRPPPPHGEKAFLYDIVANGRNGIDVDKFDYIIRDSRACGVGKFKFCKRLMTHVKVIDNEICYKSGLETDLCKLFDRRADLFRVVYTHRKVKALELMLADVLVSADYFLGISAMIHDPEVFYTLEDSILKTIEVSSEVELKEAREIVRRMRKRDLYRYCNEFLVPVEDMEHFKDVKAEDIVCCARNGAKLEAEDVLVSNVKIDFTCGKASRLEGVHFFGDWDSLSKLAVKPESVSKKYAGEVCADRIVRLYVKKQECLEAASEAFEEYQRRAYKVNKPLQVHGTPDSKKRRS